MSLTDIISHAEMLIPAGNEAIKQATATPVTLLSPLTPLSPSQPESHNTFTVSYANRPSHSGAHALPPSRDDMAYQAQQVRAHRQALHEAFIAKHEAAIAAVSETDRRTGVKMLLRLAATRDVALAEQQQYPQPVLQFMRTTWQQFLSQADAFLNEPAATVTVTVDGAEQMVAMGGPARSTTAVENISSIGVWFSGPNVSLPLRQYAVQVPNPNSECEGEMQTIIVVGLLSFSYSSYIMQLRSIAQQSVLAELKMIEEQLGTRCLFAPKLLVTP